jgi:hypothetical protein
MPLLDKLTKRLNELGAATQAMLYLRVPVDTGRLKRSIKVSYKRSNDSVSYSFGYLHYGVYVNLGTKQYNTIKWGSKESIPFNLPAYRGYRKGNGGIQPQYWLSLSQDLAIKRFKQGIIDDIKEYVKSTIKK